MKQFDNTSAAWEAASAWKTAFMVVSLVCAALGASLVYKSINTPAYLIPYEFSLNNGRVKVQPGKEPDSIYLQNIAIQDLTLLLTWTPNTVQMQVARFLNRLTREMYASQSVKLSDDALKYSRASTTQAFYPGPIEVSGLTTKINGTIVRWEGSKEVARAPATYIIKYKESSGYLEVDSVSIE